jgi:hypothetical protein
MDTNIPNIKFHTYQGMPSFMGEELGQEMSKVSECSQAIYFPPGAIHGQTYPARRDVPAGKRGDR